jgi:hypothetical protein
VAVSVYDRRAFALAFAEAQRTRVGGVDAERAGYVSALLTYRAALLAGLERLFGLRLDFDAVPDGMKALLMLFRSTAKSYLAIASPGDGYLEAGLIHARLARAGVRDRVLRGLQRIDASNAESRAAHLDILEALLGVMLGANADRVVREEELRAIGVNPTPPDPGDYDF